MEKLPPRWAIYPGTFDPLTHGHVSLVKRALEAFDGVVLAVAESTPKTPLFTVEERVDMAREVFADDSRVVVEPFGGLLVDYAARRGAAVILRGLRAVSDFEYEFQMALMNRRLHRHIQTVFLMTDYKWMYLSSTIVKEVSRNGGNIKGLVPEAVLTRVYERLGSRR
jgi:pantetheine-phosphate adenylyltransferase